MNHLLSKTLTILLEKINLTYNITLNKKRIKIPIVSGIGYSTIWTTELWMIDILKILLFLKDGVFIDIGANIGQTLIKLKCVNPDTQYFGFEPNPSCVFYMRELIKKGTF